MTVKIFKINKSIRRLLGIFIALSLMIVNVSFSFAQERLIVRSGDHPNYSRVVFDWERNVGYSAELVDGNMEVNFNANAVPNFTAVLLDGPTFLRNPTYRSDNGNLTVIFEAFSDGQIRHFKSGTRIVVDLVVSGNVAPEPIEEVASDLLEEAVPDLVEEPVSSQILQIAVPETDRQPLDDRLLNIVAPTSGDGQLTIRASVTNDAITLDYISDDELKAAAFIRSNRLWVVFDKYMVANHGGINSLLGGRVLTAEQHSGLSPTILTYSIMPYQNARMVKTSSGWQVSLRSNVSVPLLPIEIGHQTVSSVGENIFLMVNEPGNVVNVEDPYIGDNIAIVTSSQSSQGVMQQNEFTEFNILKSAQGIALELIADDIFVTRHKTGVAVTGQYGLAVSKSNIPILREALPVVIDNGGSEVETVQQEQRMLLDFEKWEIGPLAGEGYTKNRHELLYQLSTVANEDRNEARWNLAVYNLANDNAAEAIGILQLIAESEPVFKENPSYRAVLGVSNFKLRRFDRAIELFSHNTLVAELDVLLWRSLAYEAKGEYQKAMDDFNWGLDIVALQNDDLKVDFLFSSLRSADSLGDVEYMNRQLNAMRKMALNARQLTELDYWSGQLAEEIGDDVLAGEEYDKVIAAGVRYPASLAKLARVNQQYRLGEIEAMQAIDALEKLRFAWRGDDFELDILRQLGEFYVDQNEYRDGLFTLRQAATYFPRSPKSSGLTKKMTDIYYDLFINGKAENMTPLSAMALFLEFRELTPLGTDGDTMTRNLANRMVTVDLLNDAADLLEFQVENRLQGVARADIASDLAMIYVLNKEPEKALRILRSTRQSQVPDDIEFDRRMIEIRSLVEMGNYEEAEVMLEGISGEVANNLLSDIYWKTEDWRRVVSHGHQVLGDRWSDSLELNSNERQSVLRMAVALALDENLNGLEEIRGQYMGHMENGMFADAFEIITAKEQKTGEDIRQLTQTIASVDRLETFMTSYRNEFEVPTNLN